MSELRPAKPETVPGEPLPGERVPGEPVRVEPATIEPVAIEMGIAWRYCASELMSRFLEGLRERRIEALRCGGCGRRYLPPRPMCGRCSLRMTEWVPVADNGEIAAWTVVHVPVLDSRTGEPRPLPYGMALIRLDGADTTVNHYLDQTDPAKLAVGQRVRAVWREVLVGAMDDISHFEVLP